MTNTRIHLMEYVLLLGKILVNGELKACILFYLATCTGAQKMTRTIDQCNIFAPCCLTMMKSRLILFVY